MLFRLHYKAKDTQLSQALKLSHYLLDRSRKVMYCWNHKVASSFWMWIFQWIHEGGKPNPSMDYQYSSGILYSCKHYREKTVYSDQVHETQDRGGFPGGGSNLSECYPW